MLGQKSCLCTVGAYSGAVASPVGASPVGSSVPWACVVPLVGASAAKCLRNFLKSPITTPIFKSFSRNTASPKQSPIFSIVIFWSNKILCTSGEISCSTQYFKMGSYENHTNMQASVLGKHYVSKCKGHCILHPSVLQTIAQILLLRLSRVFK